MVSAEIPEVIGMSDRILVMSRGRFVDEISAEDTSEEEILIAATGV